jgi:cell division septum initiation protein DivIVA
MFWQRQDRVQKTEYEELQDYVDLLAQAAADNNETNITVIDVLGRLVDNITDLKQENSSLRQRLEEQNILLQKIAGDVDSNRRILVNQDKRLRLLDKRLAERQSSYTLEEQEQLIDRLVERQNKEMGQQLTDIGDSLIDQVKRILNQPQNALLPPSAAEKQPSKPK